VRPIHRQSSIFEPKEKPPTMGKAVYAISIRDYGKRKV
jgi:hypothetical protein